MRRAVRFVPMAITWDSPTPDWQPTLTGGRVLLRPLRRDDLDALHAAASDPLIWAQHSARTRHERGEFERFFAGALASSGALVAAERTTGRIIGSSRFYEWDPDARSVLVGYTFLAREHWGNGTNRQMKQLMLDHAFRWARIVRFHASPGNLRSRRALEGIGAALEGEHDVLVDGTPSRRTVYAIGREAWRLRAKAGPAPADSRSPDA